MRRDRDERRLRTIELLQLAPGGRDLLAELGGELPLSRRQPRILQRQPHVGAEGLQRRALLGKDLSASLDGEQADGASARDQRRHERLARADSAAYITDERRRAARENPRAE